jgi:hypothetical protein
LSRPLAAQARRPGRARRAGNGRRACRACLPRSHTRAGPRTLASSTREFSGKTPFVMSVRTRPGLTWKTNTPWRRVCSLSTSAKRDRAALLALHALSRAVRPSIGPQAALLEILMIRPCARSIIPGRAALQQRKAPSMFTSNTRHHSPGSPPSRRELTLVADQKTGTTHVPQHSPSGWTETPEPLTGSSASRRAPVAFPAYQLVVLSVVRALSRS